MMSTSPSSVSTDDCSPNPNDCSPDHADMHSPTNSMGNATDTMTGLFKSFLRLSVALVVLIGLSTGTALGQTFLDPSQSGVGGTGTQADPYLGGEFDDALIDAGANGTIVVLNSGDLNNLTGRSQYDVQATAGGNITLQGDGEGVTLTLDLDLNLGANQLTLDGVSSGDGVNVEFPGNDISLLADGSAGTNVISSSSSDTANRIVFSGDGAIEELNQTNPGGTPPEVVIERLSVEGGPVTYESNDDPGVNPDELTVNQFLAIGGELDLGGNVLNYGQTSVDIAPDANDLNVSGTVTNGQRFNINLGDTRPNPPNTYTVDGSGDLEVPVTYQNGGALLETIVFQQTSIGQFGFSNFGTGTATVEEVNFPNLSQVRASIQIEGSDADVSFGTGVTVENTVRILSNATVETGSFTANGDVEIDNSVATFGDISTFSQQLDVTGGSTVDFNNAATFEGATTIAGAGTTLNFNAPGAIGASTFANSGSLTFTNGEINLGDDTGNDNGLHDLEVNGDATFGAGATFNEGNDGAAPRATRIFVSGSGIQDIDVTGGTTQIARLVTENSASLSGSGILQVTNELYLRAGIFTTNGSLNAAGIELFRIKRGSDNGRIRSGPNSAVPYTGSLGDPDGDGVTNLDVPTRVEYRGDQKISTGDELVSLAEDDVDRVLSELAVNMDPQVSDPDIPEDAFVVTLNPDYTITDRLEILGGNLSLGSASVTLANGVTFVRGDGALDPGPVPPEDALIFPDVSASGAGANGIDLEYLNTVDVEVGIEWPDVTQDQNVIRSVLVHPGNASVANEPGGVNDSPGEVALGDGDAYRLNSTFAVGGGTFNFNETTLETRSVGSTVFGILRPGETAVDDQSQVRFIGLSQHVLFGGADPNNGTTFTLPSVEVDKPFDPANPNANRSIVDVIADPNATPAPDPDDGFEVQGDVTITAANDNFGVVAADFDLDFFEVTGDFNQTGDEGTAFLFANRNTTIEGDVTKAAADTSSLYLQAGNRVEIGGSLTQDVGTIDRVFNQISLEGGTYLNTLSNVFGFIPSATSEVTIGGDVNQNAGVLAASSSGLAVGPSGGAVPFDDGQVSIGGDFTQTSGLTLFTDPFNFLGTPDAVDVSGDVNVSEGFFVSNLGDSPLSITALNGFSNRRETFSTAGFALGDAAATTSALQKSGHLSSSSYTATRSFSDQTGWQESLFDGSTSSSSLRSQRLNTVRGAILSATEEEVAVEDERIDIDIDLASSIEARFDALASIGSVDASSASISTPAPKQQSADSVDTYEVRASTEVSADGRFFLSGFELRQGGDFTFKGDADNAVPADPDADELSNSGFEGLIRFAGDEPQVVDVHSGDFAFDSGQPADSTQANRFLNSVAINNSAGVILASDIVLNQASSGRGTASSAFNNSAVDRPFGTLALESGNIVTEGNEVVVLQPTPTSGSDLAQAVNADERSPNGGVTGASPVLGGTQASHIVGNMRRAVEDLVGSTGGFVQDGYIFPIGTGEEYAGFVVELPTDFGSPQFATVSLAEDPEVSLPDDLSSKGVDIDVQASPYWNVQVAEEPDEDPNIRAISTELDGINEMKAMRLIQLNESENAWQVAGEYDDTGDPNDDLFGGPNSFISGIPNVVHEGVDLAQGGLIGFASEFALNPLGATDDGVQITGTVSYSGDSGIEGADVTATQTDGDASATTTTDANGDYSFAGLPTGTYEVTASVSGEPQGINATDALLAVQFFAGSASLSDFQQELADVNDSGGVNATDALLVAQFTAGNTSSFNAGTFASTTASVDASTGASDVGVEIGAYGDVNLSGGVGQSSSQSKLAITKVEGSGSALAKTASASTTPEEEAISVPLSLDRSAELGAYTLSIDYPADKVNFEGVSSEDVLTREADGTVHLAWFDRTGEQPLSLNAGDAFATLQFTPAEGVEDGSLEIETIKGELAGADATTLSGVGLQVPEVGLGGPESFAFDGNYPNPVGERTTISFDLPEQANVSLDVYDVLGRNVMSIPKQSMSAGAGRSLSVDASDLSSGTYLYRLQVEMGDQTIRETGKMNVVK